MARVDIVGRIKLLAAEPLLDCMCSVTGAKEKFPGGWKAPRPYLRIVPQPK